MSKFSVKTDVEVKAEKLTVANDVDIGISDDTDVDDTTTTLAKSDGPTVVKVEESFQESLLNVIAKVSLLFMLTFTVTVNVNVTERL